MRDKIKQILTRYWGYTTFRPLQEEIILSVLEGRDTLALLPTGGGKSITFQVPALAKEGICVVISPLISLMKDQVNNLHQRKIPAKAIYSGMPQAEIRYALEQSYKGQLKILYISPERAITETFINYYTRMNVSLLAIDEAHCISQWGYDFRPPYLKIAQLRQYHPNVPILAVTASATPDVVDDIQEKLEFRQKNVYKSSFERRNLAYEVYYAEDKLSLLLEICKTQSGTGIIYVRTRKKTKEISELLKKNKISADFYHAGLTGEERDSKQKLWTVGKTRIIIATNAFGLGIDKSDVRFVIHIDLPNCIEAYFQEAGRAGRDDKNSRCILFFNISDIDYNIKQIEKSYPPIETIKKIYFLLGNYFQLAIGAGKDISFDFDITSFSEQYNLDSTETFYSLQLLEKQGLIILSEAIHSPSRILITVSNKEIYKFRVENPNFDPFIQTILRSYPGLFNDYVRIDETRIAKQIGVETKKVIDALHKLDLLCVISYLPYSDKPKVTYITNRLDENEISLDKNIYDNRKKRAYEQFESVKLYAITTTKCRSIRLLNYFGQENAKRCGNCDVCMGRNELDVNQIEFNSIVDVIKPTLKSKSLHINKLYELFPFEVHKKVNTVLRWLLDNNKAFINSKDIISWNKKSN